MIPLGSGDPIGDIAVKATTELSEGAAVTYARLRELEKDDVTTSESAALAAYAATASAPVLLASAYGPVEVSVSASEAVKGSNGLALFQSKMASEMMGAWATAVHDAGEKRDDFLRSPINRATEAYWREFRNGEHLSAYSSAHSVTATLVIGATFVGFIGPLGRSETHISYNTTADAMQQITPMMPGPGDMRAELGLIGATLAYGAVFQASWITVGESIKAPNKGDKLSLQFATNYADRVIAQVKDPANDALLGALITQHMEGTEKLTPEKMQEIIATVKLGILMSAAALFYQIDTGGQTGMEVAALLDPKAPQLEANNPRTKLLNEIRKQLFAISDPAMRASALEKIMAFLDESKSVKSLTDPVTILVGLFSGDAGLNASAGGAIIAA